MVGTRPAGAMCPAGPPGPAPLPFRALGMAPPAQLARGSNPTQPTPAPTLMLVNGRPASVINAIMGEGALPPLRCPPSTAAPCEA